MAARIDVTDALVNSTVSPIRLTQDTDLYFTQDCNYPHAYGNVIANDVLGLRVRVFGAGCALNNSVGGQGESPATAAVGINLYRCSLEVYGLRIGDSAKFKIGAQATAQTDGNGHPIYSTIPGRHRFDLSTFCGFQIGLQAHGDDMTLRDVIALRCGGGAVAYKPIGFDLWGHRQIGANMLVQDMIKGPNDLEVMGYHIEDGGAGSSANGSSFTGMKATNATLIPNSFGIWFNSTDKLRAVDFDFSGWDHVFSGDTIGDGWARGHAENYATLNSVGLTLELTPSEGARWEDARWGSK